MFICIKKCEKMCQYACICMCVLVGVHIRICVWLKCLGPLESLCYYLLFDLHFRVGIATISVCKYHTFCVCSLFLPLWQCENSTANFIFSASFSNNTFLCVLLLCLAGIPRYICALKFYEMKCLFLHDLCCFCK